MTTPPTKAGGFLGKLPLKLGPHRPRPGLPHKSRTSSARLTAELAAEFLALSSGSRRSASRSLPGDPSDSSVEQFTLSASDAQGRAAIPLPAKAGSPLAG